MQPRKLSRGTELPPPTQHGHQSIRKVVSFDVFIALISYFHSVAVIVFGSFLLLSIAPSFSEYTSSQPPTNSSTAHSVATTSSSSPSPAVLSGDTPTGASTPVWWLASPTTYGQSILFLLSSIYFTLDIAALHMRNRFNSSKGQRVLVHHLLSIAGLTSCIFYGADGPLVLFGFVLAEMSNPPFHVLQLCKYATKSQLKLRCANIWLRRLAKPILYLCLSMDLSMIHVLIFVLTRLMCLQFTAHAVMPFAQLLSTKVISIVLCLLSVAMFLDLLPALQGESKHGWRAVMNELRQMQSECDSSMDESTDEHSYHERKKYIKGGSGSSSPRPSKESASPPTSRTPSVKKKLF